VLRGAKPVFVDIRPDTLNIDERLIEAAITSRTRAIVVVHYAGIACDMDPIMAIAARRGLRVVEDNAHGLFGLYKGRLLGTIGTLGTQSFHETKNFTCGEGGALVINDASLIDDAEIFREKGTNRARMFRGEVDKYTWVSIGSSYVLSDLLAAFLQAQLEAKTHIQRSRKGIWNAYARDLGTWANANGVVMPTVPPYSTQAYHLFYLLLPTLEDRQAFIAHLRAHGIASVFHYLPLNRSDMARELDAETPCPITENISDRLVRLPFYNDLSADDQARAIQAIVEFRPKDRA
jgi:dTDP-4-amino-4,6-dideoxygalactose transaminase